MKEEYIVRADFYPNGQIVPLGITGVGGETIYIHKYIENKQTSSKQSEFICFTEKGEYKLTLNNKKWTVKVNDI
ncbi:MAG: hypothetical protein IJE10_10965 [Clostridia bacterium]|nr:hypothetical protein [Clostridia bacterium]